MLNIALIEWKETYELYVYTLNIIILLSINAYINHQSEINMTTNTNVYKHTKVINQ